LGFREGTLPGEAIFDIEGEGGVRGVVRAPGGEIEGEGEGLGEEGGVWIGEADDSGGVGPAEGMVLGIAFWGVEAGGEEGVAAAACGCGEGGRGGCGGGRGEGIDIEPPVTGDEVVAIGEVVFGLGEDRGGEPELTVRGEGPILGVPAEGVMGIDKVDGALVEGGALEEVIDGFGVSWWGPEDEGGVVEEELEGLGEGAAGRGGVEDEDGVGLEACVEGEELLPDTVLLVVGEEEGEAGGLVGEVGDREGEEDDGSEGAGGAVGEEGGEGVWEGDGGGGGPGGEGGEDSGEEAADDPGVDAGDVWVKGEECEEGDSEGGECEEVELGGCRGEEAGEGAEGGEGEAWGAPVLYEPGRGRGAAVEEGEGEGEEEGELEGAEEGEGV